MENIKSLFKREQKNRSAECGVGLVMAEGPDQGLYVRAVSEGGPVWKLNCEHNKNDDGREGAIIAGDCLLDIQECISQSKKGTKHDVFALPLPKVLKRLMGPSGSVVELSFRRITDAGLAIAITVPVQRGLIATQRDIDLARVQNMDAVQQHRFKKIDEDNSGTLTMEEIVKYLQDNPIPGMTSVWETAAYLFRRADRDRSGEVDAAEFRDALAECIVEFERDNMKKKPPEQEEEFANLIQGVQGALLETVREIPHAYMIKLLAVIECPEENFLVQSMYKLQGVDPKIKGSGMQTLYTGMLVEKPEFFWGAFVRVSKILRKAQGKITVGSMDMATAEEEQEISIANVRALFKDVAFLSEEEVAEQQARLPNTRNLNGRTPGRGIPVRQWAPENHVSLFDRQATIEWPEPFWGRNDTVLHVIEGFSHVRMTTICGGIGSGKTAAAEAVVFTLQERARNDPDGRYMYEDGVHMARCSNMDSIDRLAFLIARTLGQMTPRIEDTIAINANANFLLILDGLKTLVTVDPHGLRKIMEQMMEGIPGLTILVTCPRGVGIPFENVVGLGRLSDTDVASLMRQSGAPYFTASERLISYIYGQPFAVRLAARLVAAIGMNEVLQVMVAQHETDKKKIGAEAGVDPWVDNTRIYYDKEGNSMGAALCLRAWINLVTGYIGGGAARAFGVLRLLSFLPSGLTREDLMSLFVKPEDVRHVLDVICDQFYLLEVADEHGNRVSKYTAVQILDQKLDTLVFRLRPCVLGLFAENSNPLKFECARNLDNMLPRLMESADIVHKTFAAARTVEGLRAMEMCENTCWSVTRPDYMLREGFINHKHASIEVCGHISLYLAMMMLSLNRNHEAMLACRNAARFFRKFCEFELSAEQIQEREKHPEIKMRGPSLYGQALRLAGEVKLQLGCCESAAIDLRNGFALMSPIKEAAISCNYNGSHIGQADILWAMAEMSLTMNDHDKCDFYSRRCLRNYTDLDSPPGIAFSRSLRGQLRMCAGDMAGAYREFNFAIKVFREFSLNTRLAEVLCFRAELAFAVGNIPRARVDAAEAGAMWTSRHDLQGQAFAKKLQAEGLIATGFPDKAIQVLQEAAKLAAAANHVYIEGECQRLTGEIWSKKTMLGDTEPRWSYAQGHFLTAIEFYKRAGYRLGIANTLRALGGIYLSARHPQHAKEMLQSAMGEYEVLKHRLGVAVCKVEIARILETKKGKKCKAEAKKLFDEAMPAIRDVEKRVKTAARAGMVEVAGAGERSEKQLDSAQCELIEEDPYWKQHLASFDFGKTSFTSASELVQSVLGVHATEVTITSDAPYRNFKVGETGVDFLDRPNTWKAGVGWIYNDDADHAAFDEVHWMTIDEVGKAATAQRKGQYMTGAVAMLAALGIDDDTSDENLRELAIRSFEFFDDDASGRLTSVELQQSFAKMGLEMDMEQVKILIDEIDEDGDGMVDVEEFVTMVSKEVHRLVSGHPDQELQTQEARHREDLKERARQMTLDLVYHEKTTNEATPLGHLMATKHAIEFRLHPPKSVHDDATLHQHSVDVRPKGGLRKNTLSSPLSLNRGISWQGEEDEEDVPLAAVTSSSSGDQRNRHKTKQDESLFGIVFEDLKSEWKKTVSTMDDQYGIAQEDMSRWVSSEESDRLSSFQKDTERLKTNQAERVEQERRAEADKARRRELAMRKDVPRMANEERLQFLMEEAERRQIAVTKGHLGQIQ